MSDRLDQAVLAPGAEPHTGDLNDPEPTVCAGCGRIGGVLDARGYCWACQKEAA